MTDHTLIDLRIAELGEELGVARDLAEAHRARANWHIHRAKNHIQECLEIRREILSLELRRAQQ